MSESSEGGYETALDDDKDKASHKKVRPAARDESSDDDDSDNYRRGRARMVTSIPKRFKCSRCAKCKYQSKGTFYCRVNQLHLWAPGWEDADQKVPWDPPRNFLKWLRNSGPVVGCETDQDVLELSLENPLFLDSFPWYRSAGWGPDMFKLPIFHENKPSPVAERVNSDSDIDAKFSGKGKGKAKAKPKAKVKRRDHRSSKKARKRAVPSSSSSSLSSLSSESSLSSSSSLSPPRASRKKGPRLRLSSSDSSSDSSIASISDSDSDSSGSDSDSGGSSPPLPSPSKRRAAGKNKKDTATKRASKKTAAAGGRGKDGDFVRAAVSKSTTSASSAGLAGGGRNDTDDVAVVSGGGGGGTSAAAPRSSASSSLLHAMGRPPSSSPPPSASAERGGGRRSPGAGGGCSFRIEGTTVITSSGRGSPGSGRAGDGGLAGAGTPGDKGSTMYKYRFAEPGSPRMKGCAEGTSGSAWKGIGDAADSAGSGGGSGSGSGRGRGTARRADSKKKKPAGRQWAAEHRPLPPGKKSSEKDVEMHEERLLRLWEEEGAGKREHELERAVEKRRAAEQRPLSARQRSLDAEEQRRNLELAEMKKTKRQMEEETEQSNAEAAKQREEDEVAKYKVMLRRNQLAYWAKGRPALVKVKPTKLVATPIIPQDQYRNALQNMVKLDESFPSPESQGQADDPPFPFPAPATNELLQQPRDYHYYHQLGGAGAERQPHQGFTKTHVPPPTIPVGLIAPGLVGWQQETKGCLGEEWPLPASTGGIGITSMLRRGNVVPGGRWGENSGGAGGRKFGGAAEGASESAGPDANSAAAAAAVAVLQQQGGVVDTAAAAGQASDRHQQQQQAQHQRQHEQYQQQLQYQQQQLQHQQQQLQYQQRAARTGRSSDLRKVFHGNSQDDILNCTREAMRSRLHFWAREIPIFVEQGGELETAANEIPVNMSVIRGTIGPGESTAWAGKSLDTWNGLKSITVEGEEERERGLERKLEQERSIGGKGTADAPLDLGDDNVKTSSTAGTTFAHHRLYDVHGGGAPARHRTKQRSNVVKNGVREGMESDGGGGGGGGGGDGAAAAGGMDVDSLVAESSEPARPDRASGKRSSTSKNPPHYSFNREKSSWDATTTAAKTPSAKKANDGGAGSGAASGRDGPKDSASASRRYRITSASHLPPGWKVARIEQPDKHGYACRWYVYKYPKSSNLEDLKFKNLRDVEDFIHSDQPGAKIHRRAIDKGRRQTEAIIDKAQRKSLKRRKKEDREDKKRKKAAKSGGKGSRGPYYKKPKAQAEGDLSRKRHAHGEESKKDKKRRKKQEGSAAKSGGSRRSRDDSDDDSDDSDDDAGREARLKAKREAKREREARREAKRAAAAAGKPLGSKNKKYVPKEQHSDEEGEEDGGGGAGTPGGDRSSKDKGASASSEGGEKQKGIEDNVEREIMEIVGAYSNPEARSKLLAQLREHARQDARLQQEKKGTAVSESGGESGGESNTEKDADAELSGERSDAAECDKTEKAPPAEASTEQAPKDTPLRDEKNGTAVSEEGEEPKAKAKKDAGAAEVSGQQRDAAGGDKAEKVSPAEASTVRAPQDACEHQKKPRVTVPEPGDEPMAKKDDEGVKVLGQQSDVAGGDKTEKASPAEASADHRESPKAEDGQEDEAGRKCHEKGKKKDKPARGEQRRSPRTSGGGRAATFFGGSGGGRSSPRLSGECQAASFGSGGGGGSTGAGKKKRKADSPSSAGGSKRHPGAGREDDDNRRQSSRAASAAATAALTGSS